MSLNSRFYNRLPYCINLLRLALLLLGGYSSQSLSSESFDNDPAFALAWQDLQVLADDKMQGRAIGSEGSRLAQDFILARFAALGLAPVNGSYRQSFIHDFSLSKPLTGVNLVGMRRGCVTPEHFIVITAHYDHLPMAGRHLYNGADDNASGVAGLLYLAKKSAEECPAYSQLFVATDGEERGLFGAKAFWSKWTQQQQVVLNINLDMISRGEKSSKLYLAGKRTFPQLKALAEQVNAGGSPVKLVLAHDHRTPQLRGQSSLDLIDWPNASDHAIFRRAGIPYCYYGVDTHPQYHTVDDDWQRIKPEFFQQALAIIAQGWRFADAQPLAVYQQLRKAPID